MGLLLVGWVIIIIFPFLVVVIVVRTAEIIHDMMMVMVMICKVRVCLKVIRLIIVGEIYNTSTMASDEWSQLMNH
jgi:hypothetical protein